LSIPEKILFVDDEVDILNSFKRLFRKKAPIYTATSGQEALDLIDSGESFAVIVSGMRMPNMDGAEFLEKAKQKSPSSIRILLTGHAELDAAIAAINKGQIFRFLSKPCPQDVLQDALKSAIRQHRLMNAEKDILQNTLRGSIELLSELLSILKPNIFSNFNRIKKYIRHMAIASGKHNTWDFEVAGMLYSLGYLTLSEELMDKALSPDSDLTNAEKLALKDVPLFSSKLINHIPRLEDISEMVRLTGKVNPLTNHDSEVIEDRVLLGAEMLKIALRFDKLLEYGHVSNSAIDLLRSDEDINQLLVEKLATIDLGHNNNFITVSIDSLLPGMVLFDDLITDSKASLLAKGSEITEDLLDRIKLYTHNQKISRPVHIVKTDELIETKNEATAAQYKDKVEKDNTD
jgi:CheY-like chemotaxis protein